MRRGFLPDAADQFAVQKPTNNLASDTPNNISSVSTSEPQSVPSSSVPTADQVEEILALLKGPTDERRFVGLLLATKLLRSPDDDILRRIYEAIGLEFLDRLLLPLQLAVDAPIDALPAGDEERTARQGAEVALGLSVLAALSRLPEVAASDALAAKANLFLQVARQGGVGAALQAQHAHSMPQRTAQQQQGDAPVTPVTEAAAPVGASPSPPAPLTPALGSPAGAPPRGTASACPEGTADVQDALECALAVTGAGAAGREAMVQAGALRAALAVLQRGRAQRLAAATGGNARGQQRAQQGREAAQGGDVGDVEAVRNWLLAVRLLAVVLGGSGRGEVLAGHATEVVPLVAELARLLALPAALKRPQAAQPAAVHPGGTTFSSAAELAVQLQLEALHVLHMLLLHVAAGAGQGGGALREALSTSARHEHSAARRGGWPDAVRRGLTVILRGRVSPVERHRALQLAAAMVDLAGTEWLLGREACAAGTSSRVASGAFYQVLVEVVRIETSVLLLDALAPAERVPLAGDAARVAREAGEGAAGGPGGEHEEELDGEEMLGDIAPEVLAELAEMGDETGPAAGGPADGDGSETASQAAAGGGQKGKGSQRRHEVEGQSSSADVRMLQQVLESEVEQRKLASSWKGGAGEAAGVQGGLQQPVLEAAQPAGVGEGPAPEARPRGSWETAGQRASRLLPPCFALLEECIEALALSAQAEDAEAAGEEPQGVALPPDVSLRAITSLQEVCDALLQFLEETVGGGAPGTQGAAAGAAGAQASEARAALQAAAVRVVGRFCAEVPEAFGPRLRALLPRLLPHRASQHPPCAAAAASQPPAVMEGEAARLQDSVGEEGVGLLPFLLPMLIQQVGPPAGTAGAPALAEAGEEQASWLRLLRSEEVLPSLASNACQAAAAYTALLGQQGAASAEEDVEVAGAMLYNSVTLLLCTLRPGSAQDPASGDSPPLPPDALTYTLPLLEQLLAIIEELLQARSSPHSLKLLGGWAALCAELAAVLLAQHVTAHHGDGYLLVEEGQQQRVAAVTLGALRQTAEAVQQLAEEPGGGEGDTGSRMRMLGDLMQNLDAVSSAALSLLHVSPTFAAICAADIWLREILGEGGLAAAVSAWEAGEGQLSEWHHLLQAVQALL